MSGPTRDIERTVQIRHLGRRDYAQVWRCMQDFTAQRGATSPDELWVVEHPPVFTQGRNGKPEHVINPGAIPVIPIDRGGQVTYHGPGQLVIYTLIDLGRRKLGIRALVTAIENAIIALLAGHGIDSSARPDAPGVYVDDAKVAALGLRVSRGKSFHGLSLNVAMDLEPFGRINPCGYAGLRVTQLSDLGIDLTLDDAGDELCGQLADEVGYTWPPVDPVLRELPS